MTATRGIALGALLVAVVVVAVLLLSTGGSHQYVLVFQNAGQVVKGDDVQVGGRRIGSVDAIDLTDDNQAQFTVSVSDEFAPLHQGTTARIRATSLSGVANRYIELHPGPNNAAKLEDMARLGTDSTSSIVDLDQLFNTLDSRTRKGLQGVVQGFAAQYAGKEKLANQAIKFFDPFVASSNQLVSELTRDQAAFTDFLVRTGSVMNGLAQRRKDLASLVTNASRTTTAIGDESASLDQALRVLPETLRKGNTTFVNLRATLDDLGPLVAASKPATRRLAPFLRVLRPLVADARPTIADLRRAIAAPGAQNDLTDLTRSLPAYEAVAGPILGRSAPRALRRSEHVLEFLRSYTPELEGFIRDFGQGAAPYDANGHYARVAPALNAYKSNASGTRLTPNSLDNRLGTIAPLPGVTTGNTRRCPGTVSQAPPPDDNSAPFLDMGALANSDCDPSQRLPGP